MFNTVFILLLLVSLDISLTVPQDGISNLCVLPSYPAHGGYVVNGKPNAVPGQAFDIVRLNVTCRPDFLLVGNNIILCIDGDWAEKLPECVRSCRLNKHPSVKYRCVISGNSAEEGYRDCDLNELVGTVVKPECNAPNYYRSGVLSYMRCTNSGWNYVAVCTPECGRIASEGKEQVVGGRPAKHGELPWHSGIYTKTVTPYKQICGGSLVSTTVIITAAHCFWNKQEEKIQPASQYAVALGKLFRQWGDPNDVDAQLSDVVKIKIPNRFQGVDTNFQDDIAVVVLATTIVYRTYVRPVCLDFNKIFERRQLQSGKIGKVAGWGLTGANGPPSPVLKVLDTPYVDVAKCVEEAPPNFKQFITSDKICSGYKDGKAVCEGDSGGGLVFPAVDRDVERYYLRGIVSTAPTSDDACNAFEITSYTQVTAHTSFIEENTVLFNGEVPDRTESQVTNFCTLPAYPKHGRYVIKGEPNAYPGQAFLAVQLDVSCDPGYTAEPNVTLDCSEGSWSDDLPRCARSCKLDRHPSIQYHCLTNDKNDTRECKDKEPHGTTIKPDCQPDYFSRLELPLVTCNEGNWDNYPTCRPDCGKVPPASEGHVPWHVLINKYNDTQISIGQQCGGSLLSVSKVITAGFCFYDDPTVSLDNQSQMKTPGTVYYYVVAGNYRRDWKDPREGSVQFAKVNYIQAEYRFLKNLITGVVRLKNKNVISLAILSSPIKFTPQVSPICLDFDATFDEQQLQQGAVGKVSSRALISNKTNKDIIVKPLDIPWPYLDHDECAQKTKLNESELSADMFCTEGTIENPSNLCLVYRGTGFAVADIERDGSERYYLRGVVTLLPAGYMFCTSNEFFGVTHVQTHEKFILNEKLSSTTPSSPYSITEAPSK